MIGLKNIRLSIDPSNPPDPVLTQDCYLVLSTNQLQLFTKTVQPDQGSFFWNLSQEEMRLGSMVAGIAIELRLMHYDSCRQLGRYELQLRQEGTSNCSKTFEQFVGEAPLQASITLEFGLQLSVQPPSLVKNTDNVSGFARNSKKTNTTSYEQSAGASLIEKVNSLKQIINYPVRKWYPTTSTQIQSPTASKEVAHLRSYRQNLERKLFTSVDFQGRGKRRYIV